MAGTVFRALRAVPVAANFLWTGTRGYRFRPWRSPYLRWRVETYSGQHAEVVNADAMLRLLWAEKRQLVRFLLWLGDMRASGRRNA